MQEKKLFTVFYIFILCLSVLVLRIAGIAFDGDSKYAAAAEKQQTYSLDVASRRGYIYDCNGERLTYDVEGYIAVVSPSELKSKYVLTLHGADLKEAEAKLKAKKPFCIRVDESFEADGVTVIKLPLTSSGTLNHVTGYVNLDGDGVTGIEENFNEFLKSNGGKVEAHTTLTALSEQLGGTGVSVFSESFENEAGVILTIDKEIQKIANKAADEYVEKGAVVICDTNGDIKALVSRPDYDTNRVSDYLDSGDGELMNRTMRNYNLGSVFKIITAAAAIENGTYSESLVCDGSIKVGDRMFSCHKEEGHGEVDMRNAFINSCNPYFIATGIKTGYVNLIDMAKRFGLGKEKVLCNKIKGSAAVLEKSRVTDGLTANVSIGQGDITVSPLDAASIVLTVVNGGEYTPMRLIEGLKNSDGSITKYVSGEEKYQSIKKETADILKQMMTDTVNEGTGTSAKPENTTAGGKTASAETGWKNKEVHGWFAGFFPADNPQYVISVIVENGRSGSASAAPCFARIVNDIDNLKSK